MREETIFIICQLCSVLVLSEALEVRDGILEKHMFSKILVKRLFSEVTTRNDYFCW